MTQAILGPTFAEMLHPETIAPEVRQRAIKALTEAPLDPINLYNITWRGADKATPIPFGPYLAAAGWVQLLWGPQMIQAYRDIAGLG